MNTDKFRFLCMFLLLFGVWHVSLAQEEMKISGLVKDSQSKPLAGVQVSVKDTSQSTYTDFDGKYTLEITKGQTLVFALKGMQPQELTPTSLVVDVTMLKEGEVAAKRRIKSAYEYQLTRANFYLQRSQTTMGAQWRTTSGRYRPQA